MKKIRTIIRLKEVNKLSLGLISNVVKVSKSTVSEYIVKYGGSGLTLEDLDNLSDREIYSVLYPQEKESDNRSYKKPPDFSIIHRELKKRHVTRQLLWEEYRQVNPDGYAYSQFCQSYKDWSKPLNISMRQNHKAGEKMFVDYSGLKGEITNSKTGEVEGVEIFVASLGASGYTYAEACRNQKKQSYINSHNHAFQYFGGVPEMIIPDNLKSAVIKADWYDPDLNETYQDMAEHYGTVILPARPYRPKDKGKVELAVKLVQRWILARLRHHTFFSIEELNDQILFLLDLLNDKKIRKLGKSRRELFEELDRPALKPLPASPYVLREFKRCRVNIDYHIELEKAYYSVPYQLVGKEMDVRFEATTVEIFHQHKRVAIHNRIYQPGGSSTKKEHMASSHRAYAEWTPSRMITWGASIGNNTANLFEEIMESKQHPEMGFRTCLGIMNCAKHYQDKQAIELTSQKMIELKSYRVKHFKSILQNKTYLVMKKETVNIFPQDHSNLRGANYYK